MSSGEPAEGPYSTISRLSFRMASMNAGGVFTSGWPIFRKYSFLPARFAASVYLKNFRMGDGLMPSIFLDNLIVPPQV
jgi:hypothetical protein